MKIVTIEREISHTVPVGGFENVKPTIRMIAKLDDGEDLQSALKELDVAVTAAWNHAALDEIRAVALRRQPGAMVKEDRLPDLLPHFKGLVHGK